jgi:hypothetical protein
MPVRPMKVVLQLSRLVTGSVALEDMLILLGKLLSGGRLQNIQLLIHGLQKLYIIGITYILKTGQQRNQAFLSVVLKIDGICLWDLQCYAGLYCIRIVADHTIIFHINNIPITLITIIASGDFGE